MSLGIIKIEIIIGGEYSLWLPAEGIDLKIFLNEFNLLTNNIDDARPLYMTETFEIAIEKNENIISAIKSGVTNCVVKINNVPLLTGFIQTYSENISPIGTKTLSVSIVSAFKSMIDYMGNNVLFLDVYDFWNENFIVGQFTDNKSTQLMKFGQYLPIDKATGYLEFNQNNVNDYCQPSICLVELFKRVFSDNNWDANWEIFNNPINSKGQILLKNICLLPTKNYLISSFGFRLQNQNLYVPAGGSIRLPINESNIFWNTDNGISNGCNVLSGNKIEVLQPSRLMQFKIIGELESTLPFTISITDGTDEILNYEMLSQGELRQYSDWIDPNIDGLDPIYIEFKNENIVDIEIKIKKIQFYNLFSVYETDEYNFLPPQTYYYPIQDNYNDITILDLFKNFLLLFQIGFSSDDQAKKINFYFLNNIPIKAYDYVDINKKVLWDGYVSLGSSLEGLAKLNAIRYNGDTKKQFYFNINLPNLPSNDVYFESIFLEGIDDKNWQSIVVPNGQYQVKNIDDIPVEYLKFKEIGQMIGYYTPISSGIAAINFKNIALSYVIREFWSRIIQYLSSSNNKNPIMYELEIEGYIFEFLTKYQQKNLFKYLSNSILVGGSYSVLEQKFTGKFLSLQ